MYSVHIHVVETVAGCFGRLLISEHEQAEASESVNIIQVDLPGVLAQAELQDMVEDIASELYNVTYVLEGIKRGKLSPQFPAL
jgi:hypothetical protein